MVEAEFAADVTQLFGRNGLRREPIAGIGAGCRCDGKFHTVSQQPQADFARFDRDEFHTVNR